MMLTNAKIAAAVGLAALLLAGTGGYVYRAARGESGGAQPATKTADKPGGDKATDDAKAIQGTWKVTGVEMGGKDVSGSDEFKDLAKAKWTFTADKITFKSDKPEMSATYKIDPSKKPKEMDVTPLQGPENEKDKKTPAIYSLDGDTLKICVGSPDMPTRPTELASKEEEKNLLITFKRADAAKEKPEAKPGGDKEAIQGAWQVTAVARGGKDVSGDNEYKNLAHAEWVITADKITVKITTPGQPDESAAYTIDPSKEPKELDVNPFLPKGVNEADAPAAPAIYSLEGDVLRICVPEPRLKPVGGGKFELAARPTELTSKGSNLLITLQREKPADKAGNDNEAIQGVWQVTDFEAKGKGPDEAMLKKIKGSKWVFADGQVVVQTPGEKDSPGVVQLDPSKTPKEMDITPPGKAKGEEAIYSLEGDVLKICAPGPEGGPRPTEFAAKEGGKTVVLTLKRVKDDKGKPSDDKEALQGSWRVISLESDGKTQTDHEAEKVKQETWVFTADKLILKIPGPPGAAGQDAECSYKLDATQTPAALDLTPSYGPDKGKTIRAVYSVDGDVLKICHGEGADAERPKEIATKAGGKTTVLTLEREKGDKASR